MNETQAMDVDLFNLTSDDRQLHANVLIVHEDDTQSPSCTAVHVGHFLRHSGIAACAFPSGNYVMTSPFRIETSRLGKPFDQVTHEEIESLNEKYELATDTPYTVVRRKGVAALDESLIHSDIANYSSAYHTNRERDIEQAFHKAASRYCEFTSKPTASVTLYFSPEILPMPVESALLSKPFDEAPISKAYALLWQLDRRERYRHSLGPDGMQGDTSVYLRIHEQADGSCCIGVGRHDPLALIGNSTELAHFHHVAAQRTTAEEIATRAAELIDSHFGVETRVETAPATSSEPCGVSENDHPTRGIDTLLRASLTRPTHDGKTT